MNLNGWDLVYGASTTVINRLLAQNTGQLLSTFDYKRSETEDGFSCQVKINGNFSPWYVVKGGSNKLINVVLPIQSGTMKVTGQAASSLLGNTSYKAGDTILLDGIAVTMQMSISFKVSSQEPNVRELKFDFTDQDNAQSHSPAIVAKDITDPKNYLTNEWLKTCLKKALVDCLLANKSDIPFVFASVLNIAQPGQWAAPKFVDFYYDEPAGTTEGFFNILGVISSDAKPSDAQDAIDPQLYLLNGNSISPLYIGISKDLFLNSQVLPILSKISPHATLSSFRYNFANHCIEQNSAIPIDVNGGQNGQLDALRVYIEDTKICTFMEGNANIDDIIELDFYSLHKNPVGLSADHTKIDIQADPNPENNINKKLKNPLNLILDFGNIFSTVSDLTDCLNDIAGKTFTNDIDAFNLTQILPSFSARWVNADDVQIEGAGFSDSLWVHYGYKK